MHQDPRRKNNLPQGGPIGDFARSYFKMLYEAACKVDMANLEAAHALLQRTVDSGGFIYVAGNGGSAAIADHLCCDWTKGAAHHAFKSLKTHSFTGSTATFTALANDINYDSVFERQVEFYCTPNDILILISSSGNSPNILKAAAAAKKTGTKVIGMSGFTGGELRAVSDVSLYVPESNYGVVEDCHQSLMHILAQFVARARDTAG